MAGYSPRLDGLELGRPPEPLRTLRGERDVVGWRFVSPSGGGALPLSAPEFERLAERLADRAGAFDDRLDFGDASAAAEDFERRLPLLAGRRSGGAALRCGVSQ